jgi:phage-related minor tail protein
LTTLAFDIEGRDKSGSQAFESVGNAAEKTSKKFNVFKANAVASLAETGLMAGQALSTGLEKATSVEATNDKLAAQLGFTGEIAKEFGGIAGDLYSNAYGDSLEGVNEALKAVWSHGLVDEDAATEDIKKVAATALDFSSAMGQDVDKVSAAIGTMLKTGLAKNATEAFDVMTRGFQQGVNKADDLLDTFVEYSTQFRKLGLDATTATGLLSQGLQGGARDADTVADALKEFSIRAIDGSKTTGDAFKALGLDGKKMAADIAGGGPKATAALGTVLDKLRGMKDPVERSAAAVGLFGTKAEDLGDALYSLNPTTATNALGDVAGASQKMGETLADNSATKITAFTRSLETGIVSFIGGQVIPMIQNIVTWLKDHFGGALDAVMGIVKDVAMPVLAALGAIMLVTGAKMAIGWLIGLGPIALIVLAVTALTALIVANWDRIVGFLKAAWEKIQAIAGTVLNWMGDRWNAFAGFVSGIWHGITGAIGSALEGVKNVFNTVIGWIRDRWNDLVAFFGGIPDAIGRAFGSLASILGNVFKGAINAVISAINWAVDHTLNWLVDRANDVIRWIPGIPYIPRIPHIPTMHMGGIVPGRSGQEVLTLLEAGETVLPADSRGSLGGNVILNVYAPIGSSQELENWLALATDNLRRRGRL